MPDLLCYLCDSPVEPPYRHITRGSMIYAAHSDRDVCIERLRTELAGVRAMNEDFRTVLEVLAGMYLHEAADVLSKHPREQEPKK